jgi:hypothetical protein
MFFLFIELIIEYRLKLDFSKYASKCENEQKPCKSKKTNDLNNNEGENIKTNSVHSNNKEYSRDQLNAVRK